MTRALLVVVSMDDDDLAAYMEQHHHDNHDLPDHRDGFVAAMAVRGASLPGILGYGTSGNIARAAEAMEPTRVARAERLTNYRLGVEKELPVWGKVPAKIWQNADLGALFAGDPLMPDPCEEALGWEQLGRVSFWLAALQHRTLPELIDHLRNPAIIPGRAWDRRTETSFGELAGRLDDTLTGIVKLYPPRSEAETISWIDLVQRRMPTRMQQAILSGVRDWPGIDRRLVQAIAHGIARNTGGMGQDHFEAWAGALAAEAAENRSVAKDVGTPKLAM